MKRLVAVLAVPFVSSCFGATSFYGDEFSQYYQRPAEETRLGATTRQAITHWTTDPKKKARIGFLERYEIQVKGSREKREGYYLFNAGHTDKVGFITAEGVFYRFDKHGRLGERVGEYPIYGDVAHKAFFTGLKVFYGFPLADNVDLESIDPYK